MPAVQCQHAGAGAHPAPSGPHPQTPSPWGAQPWPRPLSQAHLAAAGLRRSPSTLCRHRAAQPASVRASLGCPSIPQPPHPGPGQGESFPRLDPRVQQCWYRGGTGRNPRPLRCRRPGVPKAGQPQEPPSSTFSSPLLPPQHSGFHLVTLPPASTFREENSGYLPLKEKFPLFHRPWPPIETCKRGKKPTKMQLSVTVLKQNLPILSLGGCSQTQRSTSCPPLGTSSVCFTATVLLGIGIQASGYNVWSSILLRRRQLGRIAQGST